jgi:hypothetical protein
MKKFIVGTLIVAFMLASVGNTTYAAEKGPGGFMGFIAGCCFGPRAGADYNDGKSIHWREWITLIPVVSLVVAVWNGIDGANGVTKADYAEQYGSTYY